MSGSKIAMKLIILPLGLWSVALQAQDLLSVGTGLCRTETQRKSNCAAMVANQTINRQGTALEAIYLACVGSIFVDDAASAAKGVDCFLDAGRKFPGKVAGSCLEGNGLESRYACFHRHLEAAMVAEADARRRNFTPESLNAPLQLTNNLRVLAPLIATTAGGQATELNLEPKAMAQVACGSGADHWATIEFNVDGKIEKRKLTCGREYILMLQKQSVEIVDVSMPSTERMYPLVK